MTGPEDDASAMRGAIPMLQGVIADAEEVSCREEDSSLGGRI